jgi:hypothetical protein
MDEIKQRLKEASDACVAKFEAWRAKGGDHAAREALQDAVHELRKVASRIEIELAVSDRKQQGNEPIPIPAHRAARRQGNEMEDDDRNSGNRAPSGPRPQGGPQGGSQGGQGGGSRPVQIRKAAEPSENAGNSGGQDDEGGARKKPLSLKRTSGDAE